MKETKELERIYDKIDAFQKSIHEDNQNRIKKGLIGLFVVPQIFLVLLFLTESSKSLFLALWIITLFVFAVFLITVEYMDYTMQEFVKEILGDEDNSIDSLIPVTISDRIEEASRIIRDNKQMMYKRLEEKIEEKIEAKAEMISVTDKVMPKEKNEESEDTDNEKNN